MNRGKVMLTCDKCSQWSAFSCRELPGDYARIFKTARNGAEFRRDVSHTDCANAYSAVLAIQPKSMCKITKINLCFIRGRVPNGVLPFIDPRANLPDTLTKMNGNLEISVRFRNTGYFVSM